MQPKDSLTGTSDKFAHLDQILSCLAEMGTTTPDLNIALVAHNIKELDLLEVLTLGKHFRTKRLSGTSLFDEKYTYPEERPKSLETIRPAKRAKLESQGSESPDLESRDSTPSQPQETTKGASYSGYVKDNYDYSWKRDQNNFKQNNDPWLFLATKTHLMHDDDLFKNTKLDLVITFDPLFDASSSALRGTGKRGKPGRRTKTLLPPILRLVIKDSPDHYILAHKKTNNKLSSNEEHKLLVDSLKHFLASRVINPAHGQVSRNVDYQKIIVEILAGNLEKDDVENILPDCKLTSVPSDFFFNHEAEILTPMLAPLSQLHTKFTLCHQQFDLKSYQSQLMDRTLKRLVDVQKNIDINKCALEDKRLQETMRQNSLDILKESIGRIFKQKEESDKVLTDSEKRLTSLKTENSNLKNRLSLNKTKKEEFSKLTIPTLSESDLNLMLTDYENKLKVLRQKLTQLKTLDKEKLEQNETLRSKYQAMSATAAEKVEQEKLLKSNRDELEKKLKFNYTPEQITLGSYRSQRDSLESQLRFLNKSYKFLQDYISNINKTYNCKISESEDPSKRGRSSLKSGFGRTSNNSMRSRTTRSTTPMFNG